MGSAARDTRLYDICDPYHGDKGTPFLRIFKPAFLTGIAAKSDKFANYAQHLRGEDAGAVPPSTEAQRSQNAHHVNNRILFPGEQGYNNANTTLGTNGLTAAERASWQTIASNGEVRVAEGKTAFLARAEACVASIRNHVVAPGIRADIDTMMRKYHGRLWTQGAPVLGDADGQARFPVGHARAGEQLDGAALVAFQKYGNSIARHVWGLVEDAGQYRQDDLQTATQEMIWVNLKLSDVGCTERTIQDFHALMETLSNEMVRPKTSDEKKIKLLTNITFPSALAADAIKELQNPVHGSFENTVAAFSRLWETYYLNGTIKYAKPPQHPTRPTHRVDGLVCSPCLDDDTSDDGLAAYSASVAKVAQRGSLENEAFCWNCLGWGHTKNMNGQPVCPSERRFRSIPEAIEKMQDKKLQFAAAPRRFNGNRPPSKGPLRKGSQLRPPAKSSNRPAAHSAESTDNNDEDPDELEVEALHAQIDGDGSVYDADGNFMGVLHTEERNYAMTIEGTDDGNYVMPSLSFAKANTPPLDTLSLIVADIDESIPDENASPDVAPFVLDDAGELQPNPVWQEETAPPPNDTACSAHVGEEFSKPSSSTRMRGARSLLTSILLTVTITSTFIGELIHKILKPVYKAAKHTTTAMMTLLLFQTNYQPMSSDAYALSVGRPSVPLKAVIDSGSTVTASGKESLFPKKLITQVNPGISVRSASGVLMPVAYVGTLLLKPKVGSRKAVIPVHNALYVPGMGTLTLLSPKQLFSQQRIRTYFNDQLYLEMPDGSRVNFGENNRSYVMEIESNPCDMTTEELEAYALSCPELTPELVHERCMHFSHDRLSASADCTTGLIHHHLGRFHCEACARATPGHRLEQRKPRAKTSSKAFGDRVFCDTCELPTSVPTGYTGWIAFLDDATRYLALYYVKDHSAEELQKCIELYCIDNSDYLPALGGTPSPRELVSDNGPEYASGNIADFCRELHMRHSTIVEWNPQQNAVERSHGTVL